MILNLASKKYIMRSKPTVPGNALLFENGIFEGSISLSQSDTRVRWAIKPVISVLIRMKQEHITLKEKGIHVQNWIME